MDKNFDDFIALLGEREICDRINSYAESLEKDDEDEIERLAKSGWRMTISILREYHNWLNS